MAPNARLIASWRPVIACRFGPVPRRLFHASGPFCDPVLPQPGLPPATASAAKANPPPGDAIAPPPNVHDEPAQPIPSKPAQSFKSVGQLWISGILPLKLSRFDFRNLIVPNSRRTLRSIAEDRIVPTSIFSKPFEILSVIPAPKEGGMVLKYGYDGTPEELQHIIATHLRESHIKTWYDFEEISAFPILGTPFIEDLVERHPSSWLHVKFNGPSLSTEQLFHLFRPYGRIADIDLAADGKSATVIFTRTKNAVTAQNCLLGLKVGSTSGIGGTVLQVEYADPKTVGKWMEWLQKNTKVAVSFRARERTVVLGASLLCCALG